MSVLGSDISHWQGLVDFERMRSAGARFVFIKASEKDTWVDPNFRRNWQAAQQAGLYVGAYHYYRPGYRPAIQAGNFFQVVSSAPAQQVPAYGSPLPPFGRVPGEAGQWGGAEASSGTLGHLPPVVDFEEPDTAANLKLFLDAVLDLFGKMPLIYTSASKWLNPYPAWTSAYDLWVANYTTANAPYMPNGWNHWKFWQYTKKGDGHAFGAESWNIDLNHFNGSEMDLQAYAGGVIPPVHVPGAAKVLVSSLNIRSTPSAASSQNIVASTSLGKVIAVEAATKDAQGRTWYQVGKGLFLAGWLCEGVG